MDATPLCDSGGGFTVSMAEPNPATEAPAHVVIVGTVIGDKSTLRLTQDLLADSLLSSAKTGDTFVFIGDGTEAVNPEIVPFDASDRTVFQALSEAVDATCVLSPSSLLPARLVDCMQHALSIVAATTASRFDVVIVTDCPGNAAAPRNYPALAKALASPPPAPCTLTLIAYCDVDHELQGQLMTKLASSGGMTVFGGSEREDFVEGFNRLKESLDAVPDDTDVTCLCLITLQLI